MMNTKTRNQPAKDQLRFWLSRDAAMCLAILTEHPTLSQETLFLKSTSAGKSQEYSVLSDLLLHQVPCDVLEQVLEMPTSFLGDDPLLLHTACEHHNGSKNSLQVIQFLASRFPTAVSTPDSTGRLPLHYALTSGLNVASSLGASEGATFAATIQFLGHLFPQSICWKDHQGQTPLQLGILQACSENIMDFLASKLGGPAADSLDLRGITLNLPRCQALVRALPKIKYLACRPSEWTWDGLVYLLDYLRDGHGAVQKLVLESIPRSFLTVNNRTVNLLKELAQADSLKEIHLQLKNTWYDKNRQADRVCLENLRGILNQSPAAFQISLHSFQIYKSLLEEFVLEAEPSSLSLNGCTLFDDTAPATNNNDANNMQDTSDDTASQWMRCPLGKLELVQNRMSDSTFEGLLKRVSVLPRLHHLKLVFRETENFGGQLDLTSFVDHMLHKRLLKTLTIEGLYITTCLLTDYAKDETGACLVRYIQYGQVWEDLQYTTALNHFGRRQCHDVVHACKISLVESFLQALHQFEDMEVDLKTGVRFGLLKECPSLWAS